MRQLQDDFLRLRRDMDGIQIEWLETLDKVKRLMGRIAKRAERDEQEEVTNPAPSEDPRVGAAFARMGILRR